MDRLDFCIYNNYEISVINEYCYINEDGDHRTETERFTKVLDGGRLANIVSRELGHREFSSCSIKDNTIHISHFDPMSGTGAEITFTINEIKGEKSNAE